MRFSGLEIRSVLESDSCVVFKSMLTHEQTKNIVRTRLISIVSKPIKIVVVVVVFVVVLFVQKP